MITVSVLYLMEALQKGVVYVARVSTVGGRELA